MSENSEMPVSPSLNPKTSVQNTKILSLQSNMAKKISKSSHLRSQHQKICIIYMFFGGNWSVSALIVWSDLSVLIRWLIHREQRKTPLTVAAGWLNVVPHVWLEMWWRLVQRTIRIARFFRNKKWKEAVVQHFIWLTVMFIFQFWREKSPPDKRGRSSSGKAFSSLTKVCPVIRSYLSSFIYVLNRKLQLPSSMQNDPDDVDGAAITAQNNTQMET